MTMTSENFDLPDAPGVSRPLAACESGAAMLEFALVLPVLLALCGACVELGRALFAYSVVETALRGGTRFLAQASDPGCTPICSWGAAHAIAMTRDQIIANTGISGIAVRVFTPPDPPAGTVVLRAEVDVDFRLFAAFGRIDLWTIVLSRQEQKIAG